MTNSQVREETETLEKTLNAMASRVGVTPERMLQIAISNQKHLLDLEQDGGELAVKLRDGGLRRVRLL